MGARVTVWEGALHRCHPAAGLLPACAIKRARTAEETETGSRQGAVQRRQCPLCHPGSGCCVQGAMETLAPCWRNGKLSLLSVNVNMYVHRHLLLTATRLDGTNTDQGFLKIGCHPEELKGPHWAPLGTTGHYGAPWSRRWLSAGPGEAHQQGGHLRQELWLGGSPGLYTEWSLVGASEPCL